MKISYYLKATLFILINSIFFFHNTRSFGLENMMIEAKEFSQKKNFDHFDKKENYFTKNKINPLSIFLAFENIEDLQEKGNEFVLESAEQIENQDSFIAKGDVIVKFKNELKNGTFK